jgi:hypothetical protein
MRVLKAVRSCVKAISSVLCPEESAYFDIPLFVPKLLLVGTTDSGKAEFFDFFQQEKACVASRAKDEDRTSSGLQSPLLSPSTQRSSNRRRHRGISSASSSAGLDEERPTSKPENLIAMLDNLPSSSRQTSGYVYGVGALLAELPEEARTDAKLIRDINGTVAYVIALDTFDQLLEDGSSVLEREVAFAKRLASIKRESDSGSFVVLLTRVHECEQKLGQGLKLPARLEGAGLGLSPNFQVQELAQTIADQIERVSTIRAVFVYAIEDQAKQAIVLPAMLRALYLTGELSIAGIM